MDKPILRVCGNNDLKSGHFQSLTLTLTLRIALKVELAPAFMKTDVRADAHANGRVHTQPSAKATTE